jgi:hypothetical protein
MDAIQGAAALPAARTQTIGLNKQISLQALATAGADALTQDGGPPVAESRKHCGHHEHGRHHGRHGHHHNESEAGLRYRRSERTSLFIQTQEGDIVRLRFKQVESLGVKATAGSDGETELSAVEIRARETTRLGISVEGDLNDDELAAIQAVVDQAAGLAGDFFSGNAASAFDGAAALDVDGQQLAKVVLRMRVNEQLSYSRLGPQLAVSQPLIPGEASGEVPGEAPGQAVGSSESAPQAGQSAPSAASAGPAVTAQPEAAETSPAPEAGEAEVSARDPVSIYSEVFGFLSRLLASFSTAEILEADAPGGVPTGDASGESGVQLSLKLRIFSSMVASIHLSAPRAPEESSGSEVTGLSVLSDAVETMAAANEPPLEQIA